MNILTSITTYRNLRFAAACSTNVKAISALTICQTLWLILLFTPADLHAKNMETQSNSPTNILVYGDSLSAGYGLPPHKAWVHLLSESMKQQFDHLTFINASISGETSKGGLKRFPAALKLHSPDIVILELGANDGLRGHPVAEMTKNLESMITQAQAEGAQVLLLGMRLPPNYGPLYTSQFEKAFLKLKADLGTAYIPFFLDGIAGNPALIQPDGLHPNAIAQPLIAEAVAPYLQKLLSKPVNALKYGQK